jgi:hypothetical protein
VKVHYDEGIASHIGPEPCAGVREDASEASAGERPGQPLSHERIVVPGADGVHPPEGEMDGRVIPSACQFPLKRFCLNSCDNDRLERKYAGAQARHAGGRDRCCGRSQLHR